MKIDYSKEKLEDIILNSVTYREVLIVFNRNESGASYKTLKRYITKWDIDISHFLTQSEVIKLMLKNGQLKKTTNEDLFVENSKSSRNNVKKRIINEKLIDYKCFKCGNEGEWMGKTISLILDHINGVNNDNKLINLRFACPNCNSTLETHCQGSKGLVKKELKIDKRTLNINREHLRKVIWPTKEELIELLKTMSKRAIGKQYGVSDVSVKKWCVKYGIN